MMTNISRCFFLSLLACTLLQACATNPIATDTLPPLKPGEGIAGISFDTVWELTPVMFGPASGDGPKLRISDVPLGQSAFLFVVPAGRYCLTSYVLAQNGLDMTNFHDDRCFDVEAGKLSYSGTFVPTYDPYEVLTRTHRDGRMTLQDRPRAFLNALSLSYPHIAAAAFPTGSDRSVADLAPPGPPPSGGICALLSQKEAADILAMPVSDGHEFYMQTVDACNFMHSDDESVHVMVDSAEGRAALFKGVGYDAPATGATDWTAVPSLGDKAAFGCKKDNCEVDVLWQGRVLVLVVDGTDRKDIKDALTNLARKIFPRWQAAPSTGTTASASQS